MKITTQRTALWIANLAVFAAMFGLILVIWKNDKGARAQVARDATDDAGDTLIVVTADHETGGLSINGYPKIDIEGVALFTEPSGRSTPHTVTFATGPGADKDRNGDTPRSDPDYYQPAVFSGYAAAHTGVDVGAWASGPGAEAYRGSIENTEIARKIIPHTMRMI